MQERNRSFGRVSRPVDKTAAPRQAVVRQRKPGRTKQAAASRPKQQRSRPTPPALATSTHQAAATNETIHGVAPAESPVVGASAAPVEAPMLPVVEEADGAAPIIDASAPNADEPPHVLSLAGSEAPATAIERAEAEPAAARAEAAPVFPLSMDPPARPTAATPPRAARRRPVLRLAVAGSAALACLLAFDRFSDAHRPAGAVVALAAPAVTGGETAPIGEVPAREAAFTPPLVDAAIVAPVPAALGGDDLVVAALLPPTAAERVTAKAAALPEKADVHPTRAAAPKKPAAKPVAARNGAPRARDEAVRQQASRGPILDFLSNLIP